MHHTGIKTLEAGFTLGLQPGFQLHHTGIKTASTVAAAVEVVDFNCTIQELKPASRRAQRLPFQFQLHHTGIKTDKRIDEVLVSSVFQLHHTGIKTLSKSGSQLQQLISIAPYRN